MLLYLLCSSNQPGLRGLRKAPRHAARVGTAGFVGFGISFVGQNSHHWLVMFIGSIFGVRNQTLSAMTDDSWRGTPSLTSDR